MWVLQGILFNPVHTGPQSSFDPLKLWFVSKLLILPQRQRNSPQLWLFFFFPPPPLNCDSWPGSSFCWNKTRFRDAACSIFRPHSYSVCWSSFMVTSRASSSKVFLHSSFESSLLCRKSRPVVFIFQQSPVVTVEHRSLAWDNGHFLEVGSSRVWESCLKLSSPFL